MRIDRFIHLANSVTILNMFTGFLSIIFSIDGRVETATWLIFWAAVFDAFDGKIARFAGTTSKFGMELDSLADLVSFGVAPSVLVFSVLSSMKMAAIPLALISFVPTLFVAIRLARFNVLADKKIPSMRSFLIGLPAPVGALAISFFLMLMEGSGRLFITQSWRIVCLLIVISMVAYLNISIFRFKKIGLFSLQFGFRNSVGLVVLISATLLLFIFKWKIGFWLIMTYVLKNLLVSVRQPKSDFEEILSLLKKEKK